MNVELNFHKELIFSIQAHSLKWLNLMPDDGHLHSI